jgi:hypothetical protein
MKLACSSIMLLIVLMISGCADKAQPKYDECLKLAAANDLKGAKVACEAAVAADPESKAGKAAQEKVKALASDIKRGEEAAAKAAEQVRAEAARKAQEEADAKCPKWVTFCETGGGLMEGATRVECDRNVESMRKSMGVRCAPCKCATEVMGAQ